MRRWSPRKATSWRRACAAQGWHWTREQQADLLGEPPGPFEPIERDLGSAVAAVWALYESYLQRRLRDGLDAGAGDDGTSRAATGDQPGPPKAGSPVIAPI